MESRVSSSFQTIIVALQESFIALIPYFIISSIATLVFQGVSFLFFLGNYGHLQGAITSLQVVYPLLLLVSIAFHLAKAYSIDSFVAILLAFSLLLTITPLTYMQHGNVLKLGQELAIYGLIVPIISTVLLKKLSEQNYVHFHPPMAAFANSYRHFFAYLGAFLVSLVVLLALGKIIDLCLQMLAATIPLNVYADKLGFMLLRQSVAQVLFFIGLHGVNIFDLFINTNYLNVYIFDNVTIKEFSDLFVANYVQLALALAVLLQKKDKHAQMVAKFALPFLCFNIGEVFLFGLPVVFNRYLFLPFLLCPLLNLALAYGIMTQGIIPFVPHHSLPWVTPGPINGYLASGGQFSAVLLQVFLIGLNVLICMPFVRRYLQTQSTSEHLIGLQEKLNLTHQIQLRDSVEFQKAKSFIVNAHPSIDKIIKVLDEHDLCVFYQPKVSATGACCFNFEALVRLRDTNGEVSAPAFISTFAQAGLAPVIDLWVCHQVKKDMQQWKSIGFYPHISINLCPSSIEDGETVYEIIQSLQGFDVEFEMTEEAFAEGYKSRKQINLLRRKGFCLSIDNFGTGYSSLNILYELQVDVVKLDISLLRIVNTQRGRLLYLRAVRMCKDLGYALVAVGVETEHQYQMALKCGVDLIQGSYYSDALPFEQVIPFTVSVNGSIKYITRKLHKFKSH